MTDATQSTVAHRLSWNLDAGNQGRHRYREPADESRALHAGQRTHAGEYLLVELAAADGIVVLRMWQRSLKREHIF